MVCTLCWKEASVDRSTMNQITRYDLSLWDDNGSQGDWEQEDTNTEVETKASWCECPNAMSAGNHSPSKRPPLKRPSSEEQSPSKKLCVPGNCIFPEYLPDIYGYLPCDLLNDSDSFRHSSPTKSEHLDCRNNLGHNEGQLRTGFVPGVRESQKPESQRLTFHGAKESKKPQSRRLTFHGAMESQKPQSRRLTFQVRKRLKELEKAKKLEKLEKANQNSAKAERALLDHSSYCAEEMFQFPPDSPMGGRDSGISRGPSPMTYYPSPQHEDNPSTPPAAKNRPAARGQKKTQKNVTSGAKPAKRAKKSQPSEPTEAEAAEKKKKNFIKAQKEKLRRERARGILNEARQTLREHVRDLIAKHKSLSEQKVLDSFIDVLHTSSTMCETAHGRMEKKWLAVKKSLKRGGLRGVVKFPQLG